MNSHEPITSPLDVRRVYHDGRHNAFTAFVEWRGAYWLAFRNATGHGSYDGVLVVLRSSDTESWIEAARLTAAEDDRDPQFLPTEERLFIYNPARHHSAERTGNQTWVFYTTDGDSWSQPQMVYEPGFICWKPTAWRGKFYAGAHLPAKRESHLITSDDGLSWQKISTIHAEGEESETTLSFDDAELLTAFVRAIRRPGAWICEAVPPYITWTSRDAPVHLSGHCVHTIDGVTYLASRWRRDDGVTSTIIYTYEEGELIPYCELPSGGDCSYPEIVVRGREMVVSYYSSHEGTSNIYLARVPLRKVGGRK